MKVDNVKKTGVELAMKGGNQDQGVDFIGENMLLLLYTRLS